MIFLTRRRLLLQFSMLMGDWNLTQKFLILGQSNVLTWGPPLSFSQL